MARNPVSLGMLNEADPVQVIADSPLLRAIDRSSLDGLRPELEWIDLGPHEGLPLDGSGGDALYFVASGRLEITHALGEPDAAAGGGAEVLAVVVAGDVISELRALTGSDDLASLTGFHRKHAMRLLRCDATARRSAAKASRRIYDEAVCEAIVVLWEASDRICGKRLKALMPTLVEAMERHGHMRPGPQTRAAVLAMSASTIDRSLRQVREQASGRKRRRTAAPSSVRKSIPVRTFSDSCARCSVG